MQPYERIGLVAVLFLVVLLAVGGLWDDGSSEDAVLAAERAEIERVDEEAQARAAAVEAQKEAQKAERLRLAQESVKGATRQRPGAASQMLMGGQDEVASGVSRVTTVSNGSDHRSAPLDLSAPRTDRDSPSAARAQNPEELQDFARPERSSGQDGANEAVAMSTRSPRRRQPTDDSRASSETRDEVARAGAQNGASVTADSGRGAATSVSKGRTYTVKPGDALQRIAQAELGNSAMASSIASLNGLSNPDMIRAGMVLTLPPSASGGAASGPSTNTAASGMAAFTAGSNGSSRVASTTAGAGRSYTIRSGESLSAALNRELGTYKRSIGLVKALNPGLDPDRVLAGQVIQLPRAEDIPGGATVPAGSTGNRTRPGAPALDTSPGTSTVAAADRASTSKSTRSDSEFVVR